MFWQNRILKKALYKLRQKGVTDLKNTLLEIALSCLGEHQALVEIIQTEKPLFNPLPLSKKQENKQGFNQAELLGKDLAKSLGLTYVPEVGEVKKGIKTGSYKSLLLFNDLWDRQSFLSVADSLKHKGISRVWALVLAR